MEIKQALVIVKEACGAFVGNLQDHTRIQQAIKVIEDALNKPKKK